MFAIANAGASLDGLTPGRLLQSVPMGIALRLVLDKAAGVFGVSWLLIRWGVPDCPPVASWGQFWGVLVLLAARAERA